MDSNAPAINVTESDTAVAKTFLELNLISAPVIDDDGVLLGRITIDDVVDMIIENAEETVLAQAGLDVEVILLRQCTKPHAVEQFGWVSIY